MIGHRIALWICFFITLSAAAYDCPGLAISGQPANVSACPGDAAVFTITASGNGPLTYQWRKDCMPLAGEDMATLVIDPLTTNDYGTYSCSVSDSCGTLTSEPATLSAGHDPIYVSGAYLANAVCPGDTAVLSVVGQGDNLSYQWRHDCGPIPGATSDTLVLESVDESDVGGYQCVVYNACASVTSLTVNLQFNFPGLSITQQPASFTACSGSTVQFTLGHTGAGNPHFQWLKDGNPIQGKTSHFLNVVAGAGTVGSYSCRVTLGCETVTTDSGTLSLYSPVAISVHPEPVEACDGEPVAFSVTASGSTPLTYQWYRNNVLISGATNSSYGLDASAATTGTYTCRVTNTCGFATSNGAALTLRSGPTFALQPENVLVCPDASASMTVAVNGAGPFTYQWRRDCEALDGETNATLTIPSASLADVGTYVCIVTGPCDSVTSNPATLHLAVVCSSTVPDAALRAFLLSGSWESGPGMSHPIDANADGLISLEEAYAVTGSLDCSHLKIVNLTGLGLFSNLTALDCSHNRIASIPSDFYNLLALQYLDLSHNRLTSTPDFSALTQLTYLDLSHNRIRSEETRGGGLLPSSLTELNLQGNDLTSLPDLSGLNHLHVLRAGYNRINQIQDLLAQTSIGGSAEDLIELDHNQLTDDDCDDLLDLETRTNGSGATLVQATQLDFSQLPNWPSTTVLLLIDDRDVNLGCIVP